MADLQTLKEFSIHGQNILTQWALNTEELAKFAAIFDARGGMGAFEDAQYPDDGNLTEEQIAYNEALSDLGTKALNVVTLYNSLKVWYDATQQQLININRNDF